jgi:hypothetical protein
MFVPGPAWAHIAGENKTLARVRPEIAPITQIQRVMGDRTRSLTQVAR